MPVSDQALSQLVRIYLLSVGAVSFKKKDISEVLGMPHLVAEVQEIALDHVEGEQRHAVADVRAGVRRHPADIHPNLPGLDCLEWFLLPGERVIDAQFFGHDV